MSEDRAELRFVHRRDDLSDATRRLEGILWEFGVARDEWSSESSGPDIVQRAAVQGRVLPRPDRARFFGRLRDAGLDVSLLESGEDPRPGVAAFDADSTLVLGEGIDQLAARAGVEAEVARVTDRAMAGQLGYAASLRERVALLAGLTTRDLEATAAGIELRNGSEACVRRLQERGWTVVVLSGGFDFYLAEIRRRLGVDAVVGNRLEVADGRLTGRVEGPILDAAGKAQHLDQWLHDRGLTRSLAVGDGANDGPMLERAEIALGVAPRDALLEMCDGITAGTDLRRILPLAGLV